MVSVRGRLSAAWGYYQERSAAPLWVADLVGFFASARSEIDSRAVQGKKSEGILRELAPGLLNLGYLVEASKKQPDLISVFLGAIR